MLLLSTGQQTSSFNYSFCTESLFVSSPLAPKIFSYDTSNTRFLILPLVLLSSNLNAQTVSATFGSKYDAASNTASIFSNEAKVGFDSTTTGLFALGYFNDGFSVATEAASITDSASQRLTFLGSFNVLHSQSFSDATAAGFFTPGNSSIAEQGAGRKRLIYHVTCRSD